MRYERKTEWNRYRYNFHRGESSVTLKRRKRFRSQTIFLAGAALLALILYEVMSPLG